MKIEFDPNKSLKNEKERGLPFTDTQYFEWTTALIIPDTRYEYPEPRFTATGLINERFHIIVFTPIIGGVRIISFRKANRREIKFYEQNYQQPSPSTN